MSLQNRNVGLSDMAENPPSIAYHLFHHLVNPLVPKLSGRSLKPRISCAGVVASARLKAHRLQWLRLTA